VIISLEDGVDVKEVFDVVVFEVDLRKEVIGACRIE